MVDNSLTTMLRELVELILMVKHQQVVLEVHKERD